MINGKNPTELQEHCGEPKSNCRTNERNERKPYETKKKHFIRNNLNIKSFLPEDEHAAKIETAKRLLESGVSVDEVSKSTGLYIEEVEEIIID